MKKKILHIVEWVFAIFGLILSIVMIASGGIISGLVFLISALVISPIFEKIPLLTDKPEKRTVLQFVFSFAIFVTAFFLVPTNPNNENNSMPDISGADTTTTTNITDEVTTTKETTLPITTSSISETIQTTITSTTISTTRTTSCTTSTTTSTTSTITSTKNTTASATSTTISTTTNTSGITTTTQTNNYVRNETLNGRGRADVGRNDPDYVNVIGYAVISSSKEFELSKNDNFTDESLWIVPTFEKDKQFWNETSYILPHKTEVVVLEQDLKHEGYGVYSGHLLIERLDDHTQHYIDVNNFITKPYWNYNDDLKNAALTGAFIAEYNQKSDYYPVTNHGDMVSLEDGTIILVTGTAGLSRYVHPDQTEIDAVVWKEWKLGYGGVHVYFNAEDLTIIY